MGGVNLYDWIDELAHAVDGEDAPLLEVATPGAVDALLYGGDASHDSRLVVRGPRIDGVTIEHLEASPEPAHMTLAVHVPRRRYVENRDTAAALPGPARPTQPHRRPRRERGGRPARR